MQSFGAGQQGEEFWRVRRVKRVILGRDRKQKHVKTPPPTPPILFPLFFWVVLVELQVESENLTQILGWMMDSLHSGCTCLYISTDLQRCAALSASWRWLKMHWQNISLLSPFGLRGAWCSEEIVARLWPSWLFWDASGISAWFCTAWSRHTFRQLELTWAVTAPCVFQLLFKNFNSWTSGLS